MINGPSFKLTDLDDSALLEPGFSGVELEGGGRDDTVMETHSQALTNYRIAPNFRGK